MKERTGLPLQKGSFSPQPAGLLLPPELLSGGTAGRGAKAMTLFQQRTMV
ncbi:hypothetical protein BREVNS_1427 [Brevinematales bacterium NS]|nr:hypothetical protein BREVNS_1427 [Brevinematales bacterium NS]